MNLWAEGHSWIFEIVVPKTQKRVLSWLSESEKYILSCLISGIWQSRNHSWPSAAIVCYVKPYSQQELLFFQMSAQWGYNLIIQPSDYLLTWSISLVGWFDWPLSFWSPLFTWILKVNIGYNGNFLAQEKFAHLENLIGRLIWLVKWANLSFQLHSHYLGKNAHYIPQKFSKLIFFQMSAQWGFNLIFQPSEYLLIWCISLFSWCDRLS